MLLSTLAVRGAGCADARISACSDKWWHALNILRLTSQTLPNRLRTPFLHPSRQLQAPQLWMAVVPLAALAAYPALAALGARFGAHPLWQRYGRTAQSLLEANKVGTGGGQCVALSALSC